MQIEMIVNHDDPLDTWNIIANKPESRPWTEVIGMDSYCLADTPDNLSAIEYAQIVINYFNDTLKPGESPRKLISAKWVWEPRKC